MSVLRHVRQESVCIFLIACCWLVPRELHAQQGEERFQSDSLVVAARAIMASARYCTLVTLDKTGRPQVRTMDPFAPDDGMVVWFGTNRRSRKVEQIRNDPRVALHYLAPSGAGYVSISGRARIVDDPSETARYWKDEWTSFYQNKKADYVLIAVKPETLEIIDYSRGVVGDSETWKAPSVPDWCWYSEPAPILRQ